MCAVFAGMQQVDRRIEDRMALSRAREGGKKGQPFIQGALNSGIIKLLHLSSLSLFLSLSLALSLSLERLSLKRDSLSL